MNNHSGSCLCGEVRFEVEGDFERFYLCHCQHCRKDTGSAHGANLFSASARLRWISGEQNVRLFNLPGTRHHKGFCAHCGSALPYANGGLTVVPAGSLDSAVSIRPDAHILVASKAGWDDALEQIPRMAGLPT